MPDVKPDGDPPHLEGASGGAYVELLPDTRRSHGDPLVQGENFINQGGRMAVLHYPVRFASPGRFYVWVRACSTTSEDNGLHFGIDGRWPESGARWQTVQKNGWHWDCKQRTETVHTGVPLQLWLDVATAGEHELLMSMREDGIEVDQIVLARDIAWRPEGAPGYQPAIAGQTRPAASGTASPAAAPRPAPPRVEPRQPDGRGTVTVSGELKQWHKVTLTLDGPYAHERDNEPNPFTDFAFNVTFRHKSGSPEYVIPGCFAADGDAANSGAESGTQWRAHLSPDQTGEWTYTVSFAKGPGAAVGKPGSPLKPFDGRTGRFTVAATDKTGRDFRARGRLGYVGGRYLQFAGSKEFFLKAGADAPENLLAYRDFDGDFATDGHKDNLVKDWAPHLRDWNPGDPTWKGDRGRGLVGALNYLAGKGANAVSFLTLNIGGDDQNVFPYVAYDDFAHLDVSRLDQWEIVFAHAQRLGLFLHFKTQEAENQGLLDGGDVGPQRRLYYRELIARFGHHLALNWNMGEEIGPWQQNPPTPPQLTPQRLAMAEYFHQHDPYHHHLVIHNGMKFDDLLGPGSMYTGVSIQYPWNAAHQRTLEWLNKSVAAGKPWAVANDEQNPADMGVPPDPGYQGHSGEGIQGGKPYTLHDVRKGTLWGVLLAGGWGVEYYFGYKLPQHDLDCQDFRSRDRSWDYCRIALAFFHEHRIPFWEMASADALVGNPRNDNSKYCFARPGDLYLVYLPNGGTADLDLGAAAGTFTVHWFNPRTGGPLATGSVTTLPGGAPAGLGLPPSEPTDDWLAVVRRQ